MYVFSFDPHKTISEAQSLMVMNKSPESLRRNVFQLLWRHVNRTKAVTVPETQELCLHISQTSGVPDDVEAIPGTPSQHQSGHTAHVSIVPNTPSDISTQATPSSQMVEDTPRRPDLSPAPRRKLFDIEGQYFVL